MQALRAEAQASIVSSCLLKAIAADLGVCTATHHLRRLVLQLALLLVAQRPRLLALLDLLVHVLERVRGPDGRDRLVQDVRGRLGRVEPAADAERDGAGRGEVVSVSPVRASVTGARPANLGRCAACERNQAEWRSPANSLGLQSLRRVSRGAEDGASRFYAPSSGRRRQLPAATQPRTTPS